MDPLSSDFTTLWHNNVYYHAARMFTWNVNDVHYRRLGGGGGGGGKFSTCPPAYILNLKSFSTCFFLHLFIVS